MYNISYNPLKLKVNPTLGSSCSAICAMLSSVSAIASLKQPSRFGELLYRLEMKMFCINKNV